MPQGKLEQLHQNLDRMNANIYVQRSKQLKQAPSRTRLFAWLMSDVEILALADPSIHGAEQVVNIMTEIDIDT